MTLLDVGNCVVVSPLHSPDEFTGTRDGNSVDTAYYAYALIIISVGDMFSSGTVTCTIQESSTSGGTYTACKKLGTESNAAKEFTNSDDGVVFTIAVDLNNTQRFLRAKCTHSSGAAHVYGITMVLMPYLTDTTSVDANAASAPLFNI